MNKLSIIVIDSRSERHPEWVQVCLDSLEKQIVPVELLVIDNTKREKTIGECWNEGVRHCTSDWIAFVGDDDYVARDNK